MTRIAVDTWAFVERHFNGPRADEVETFLKAATQAITTREIVGETFNFIVGRTKATRMASSWLQDLRASRVEVLEPRMPEIEEFLADLRVGAKLSYGDASLCLAAQAEGIEDVATGDGGFRIAGLRPLFARL